MHYEIDELYVMVNNTINHVCLNEEDQECFYWSDHIVCSAAFIFLLDFFAVFLDLLDIPKTGN